MAPTFECTGDPKLWAMVQRAEHCFIRYISVVSPLKKILRYSIIHDKINESALYNDVYWSLGDSDIVGSWAKGCVSVDPINPFILGSFDVSPTNWKCISGLILGLQPVNGRRRYKVRPSLTCWVLTPFQWRHDERDGVSNDRRLLCLLNCWFRCR